MATLIARGRIDRDRVNTARGNAWTKVEREWWDRGLGGFRAWCRTEGIAALERFTRAARDLERGGAEP